MLESSYSVDSGKPLDALSQKLIESYQVSEIALTAATKEAGITGDTIGQVLVRNGVIRQSQLSKVLLEIGEVGMGEEAIIVSTIPPEILIRTNAAIVGQNDTTLYVGTTSPEILVRNAIADYDRREVEFVPVSIHRLEKYTRDLRKLSAKTKESLLDQVIRQALEAGASDIHIKPKSKSYSILFRYLGVLQFVHEGNMEEYNTLISRIKDRASIDMAERRVPQDGSFQVDYQLKMIDMRVATIPGVNGETCVIRLLDPDAVNKDLHELGITGLEHWRKGISRPTGLCLICGPTGSGKTTTLSATLGEMDRYGSNILTVEDPVEYRHPFITQVSTNPAVGLGFSQSLKSFLRADPDVIIVGEVRDEETGDNLIKAAETGHMVFGTLHTGSISGAIDRLDDVGIAPNDLVYMLRSILVQRLVRTLCTNCKGEGCDHCLHSGYGGRTVVNECIYLPNEDAVRSLIKGEIKPRAMVEDAIDKYEQGVTNEKELRRVFAAELDEHEERLTAIREGRLAKTA